MFRLRLFHGWAALLTVIAAALAVDGARLDSAVADEPAYIAAGLVKVQHGRLDFFRGQPPLMNSLSAMPLAAAGYELPRDWDLRESPWRLGRRMLFERGHERHRMLLLARLPTIVLFLALCWTVGLFVLQQSGSERWALFAFALTAFCPNLLGHGRLATLDVPAAFFSFAAAALFLRLLGRPSVLVAVTAGAMAAGAVLVKTSGSLLAPWFAVVFVMAFLSRQIEERRRVMLLSGLALLAAAAVYGAWILVQGSDQYVAGSFGDVPRIAVPLYEYLENVKAVRNWYAGGTNRLQFLLGEFSARGWPHYYLVAFALKATLPALLLMVIAAVFGARRRRFDFNVVSLLVYVALFLVAAATSDLALGLRHVLPIFPFLLAATAMVLAAAPRKLGMAAAALLVWHMAEGVRSHPAHIAYFNQLIGSHRNADRYLIDSNLDWGQDLRRLDRWCRRQGIEAITLDYFGGGEPQYDLSIPAVLVQGPGDSPLPRGSWFAVSRHQYRAFFALGRSYDHYLARSGARFVTSIGGSINVYRVE